MSSSKEDIEALRKTIRRQETLINSQDGEINNLSTELSLVRNECLRLKEYNDQLLEELEERDLLKDKNIELKETIQEMKLHLAYYLEENQKQKSSVEEWSSRFSEQETLIVKNEQEILSLNQIVEERKKAYRESQMNSEKSLLVLNQKDTELKTKGKELQEARNQIGQFKLELEKLKSEFSLIKANNEVLEAENSEMRKSLERMTVKHGEMSMEIEQKDFRIEHMQREIEFFHSRNAELKTFYDILREEKAIKEIQANSFRDAHATLEAKMQIHEPVYVELEKKNESLLIENSALSKKAGMLAEQLERLEKQHANAKMDLGTKKGMCEELKKETRQAHTSSVMAQDKLKKAELEKNTVQVKNKSMKESIEKQNQLLQNISSSFYASQVELERSKLFESRAEERKSPVQARKSDVMVQNTERILVNGDRRAGEMKKETKWDTNATETKWKKTPSTEKEERFSDMSGLIQEMRGSIMALKGQIDRKETSLKMMA